MIRLKNRNFNSLYVTVLFFAVVFVYFTLFNQYHLYYLEQVQLFRFKLDYFTAFLDRPGGFSEYCGAFLTQFFLFPLIGPAIVTLAGLATYLVSLQIFRKFKVPGILWPLIPVMMLVALHSDYLYKLGYSIGLLISLAYAAVCLKIRNDKIRLTAGFIGFLILYPLTGVFSFLALILFLLNELFYSKSKYKYLIVFGYLLSIILIPYLFWRYVYLVPLPETWLIPLNSPGNNYSRVTLALLLGYFPFVIAIVHLYAVYHKHELKPYNWGWKNVLGGLIIIAILSAFIKKYSADPKTEIILKIDHYIQKSDWRNTLEQCSKYPEPNRMVTYFTNLALLKSGNLGEQMFHYNQVGPSGLSLPWTANNLIPFFGCEIFYHLGYNNEAYRWAFEAMEMNGQCPRLLKRLVMTSLINGDFKIAEKYLNQLHQSLYYKNWAEHYLKMVNNPELLNSDKEIAEKRELIVNSDFFAGSGNSQLGLEKLLENHPHNKMAYEYYLANLLLSKDMATFAKEISRLKELGYKDIPVHFEEAILWYIGYSKQNIIPEGYGIRNSTLQRFKAYTYAYSAYKGSAELRAQSMVKEFGTTFWFYFHFINPQ
jgi:hypothetical protein